MTLEALAKASEAACQRLPLGRQQITEEMQLWLLQSKHTQVWNNSRATTDAAYSLLSSLDTSLRGLTWGAVSATYTATPEEITAQGSGFQIERSLQVLHDGKWKTLSVKKQPNIPKNSKWETTYAGATRSKLIVTSTTFV